MKRRFKLTAAGFLALAAAGCGGVARQVVNGPGPLITSEKVVSVRQITEDDYRLQPGDELSISLSSKPDLSLKIQIHEDGTAFYPSIGELAAAGKTLHEVEQEIQNRLAQEHSPATGQEEEAHVRLEVLSPQEALGYLYQLQRGDQLEISVWEHTDMNQKVEIREDGSFTFPLVGSLQGSGRTLPQIEEELTRRLDQDFIVNPQVAIRLVGAQFSILGLEGQGTGPYPLDGTTDLLAALSKGGNIDTLRSSRVEIIRRVGNRRLAIRTEVDRVLRGKEPNIPIFPRDTIYLETADALRVTLRLVGAKFSVLGEVTSPGVQAIEGSMDLLAALSLAGGITKFGSNRVEIIRIVGSQRWIIRANVDRILRGREPNIPVFPRDTIYIKRRLF